MRFNVGYLRLPIFFITIMVTMNNAWSFEDKACIKSDFETQVKHKIGPFGLLEVILSIHKQKCVFKIEHKKFYSQNYEVDVCRTPIHIKKGAGGVDVIKRLDCNDIKNTSDYCENLRMLENILQDDGLIFANGEKEVLVSDHGKVYCTFSLIQKYLRDGDVLSQYDEEEKVQGTFEPLYPKDIPTPVPTP